MFKKILIFLLVFGFALSANAARMGKAKKHSGRVLHASRTTTDKVNVNKSDVNTIATVKGIGIKKAKAIVTYRKSKGNFKSINDLSNVKGIGEKRLAKIKQNLTV